MGMLDVFYSPKRISRADFEKTLRNIPELSEKERAYVNGIFQDSLKDGLSKYEIKKEISRLKYKSNDSLDSFEVEKIKKKLTGHF